MVIPKFKVLDFDKYKGTTCPQEPSKDVLSEDKGIRKDEELLIHFFQENLTGVAVTWYTNLEPSRVHYWNDLMFAFIRQYQYNFDMVPDRMQLQNMCKKGDRSFKEHAQKVEGSGGPGGTPNNGKGDDNRDGRHIIGTLL